MRRKSKTKKANLSAQNLLCTNKNDTIVKYTLGQDQQNKIFASRYKLHLPTGAELRTEIQRESDIPLIAIIF